MTLRTPRRRISPRARRRYRAIRNFFQRTFSSLTSPSGIRISSSIAVNVTNLKHHRSVAVHCKPHSISQNFYDPTGTEDYRREVEASTMIDEYSMNSSKKQRRRMCGGDLEDADTKVLYKTSDNLCSTSQDFILNSHNEHSDRTRRPLDNRNYEGSVLKRKPTRNNRDNPFEFNRLGSKFRNNKTDMVIENSLSRLGSFQSLNEPVLNNDRTPYFTSPCYDREHLEFSRYLPPDEVKIKSRKYKAKRYKSGSPTRPDEIRRKHKKIKPPANSDMNQHFNIDPMKPQYTPVNFFGRRASEFSRISAPVCRDVRYSTREMVLADSDMYSCCREPAPARRYACADGVRGMRSMCDTHLYSAHRHRPRHRRLYANDYDDSSLYDVVPVKEKSSPKSRRKFIEDNMILNEMPQSPKTRRPRPDIQMQNYNNREDYEQHESPSRRRRSPYRRRRPEYFETFRYEVTPEESPLNENNRASPKMRRKNITLYQEDMDMNMNQHHLACTNEVPPSPRTQRPRFNLETQNYSDYEDYEQKPRSRRSPNHHRTPECIETFRHDVISDEFSRNGNNVVIPKLAMRANTTGLQDHMDTTNSQQYLTCPNNTTNMTPDNTDKTQNGGTTLVADTTDKALCEIKNILQSFLQELKKDSSTSQCDQTSGTSNKNSGKPLDGSPRGSGNDTSNALKNSAVSFNRGLVQGLPTMPTQFMPGFANPCCYPPVMPVYGPCLHNSCHVPSCMCVGSGCSHNHRGTEAYDPQCRPCSKVNCTAEEATKKESETDELIREIYNFVARNPSTSKKMPSNNSRHQGQVRLPMSLGKSMHALRQDAKVGTPPLRCYSKSCEAISSRQLFDTYYSPNPSYSDSLLEQYSQETMDYEGPYESKEYKRKSNQYPKQQPQSSKFVSALRIIRKNTKKNKKNVHEVCQSEPSIEVDVMPKRRHFQQEFATYAMHGQEFLHPPTIPPGHHPHAPSRLEHDYSPHDPRLIEYSHPGPNRYDYYNYSPTPSAPFYDNSYDAQNVPQVPLCLKEVEVRSIGTQSERKAPYFRLFSQKKKAPESPLERHPVGILRDDRRRSSTTQTHLPDANNKKPLKFFKLNSRELSTKGTSKQEPTLYEKIERDLTKNDAKISNAMLKKLFHKRNPFSPQNRFVRTIMEKDTPVFKWRPRMFV